MELNIMNMTNKPLKKLLKRFSSGRVYAHCDVPCGIYDPHQAQVDAHTIIRMVMLMQNLDKNSAEYLQTYTRYVDVKEKHGESLKHEVRVIWGDYFKPKHLEQFPELNDLVWEIMRDASNARQHVDLEASKALLKKVQRFAEIFFESKGRKHKKVTAPYPTGESIVILAD